MKCFSIFIDLRSSLLAFLPSSLSSLQIWFCLSFYCLFYCVCFGWNMCRVFIYLALCFLLVVVVYLIPHLSNLLIWCFNHSLKIKYSRSKLSYKGKQVWATWGNPALQSQQGSSPSSSPVCLFVRCLFPSWRPELHHAWDERESEA